MQESDKIRKGLRFWDSTKDLQEDIDVNTWSFCMGVFRTDCKSFKTHWCDCFEAFEQILKGTLASMSLFRAKWALLIGLLDWIKVPIYDKQ